MARQRQRTIERSEAFVLTTVEFVEPVDVDPPSYRDTIGDLGDLCDSIARHGVITPPPAIRGADGRWHLLAGARRWAAAVRVWPRVQDVIVIKTWDDMALWLELDIERDREIRDGEFDEPTTRSVMHNGVMPLSVAHAFATHITTLLSVSNTGLARAGVMKVIASYVGQPEVDLRKYRYLLRAAAGAGSGGDISDEVRQEATRQLARLHSGEVTCSGAYRLVNDLTATPRPTTRAGQSRARETVELRRTARMIASAAASVSGISDALAGIENLPAGLTGPDVKRWRDEFVRGRRTLNTVIRLLRESSAEPNEETENDE